MGRQWDCRWGERMALRCQGVRERGARQERLHGRQAALPLQGLRAELHRHAAPRHAAAGEGRGGAAVPERAVDEPHRQAARRVDALGAGLDRAFRGSVRPEARARGPCRRGRAGRDAALSKKKTDKLWVWKARDRATGRLLDWELGGRDKATCERLLERLERWGYASTAPTAGRLTRNSSRKDSSTSARRRPTASSATTPGSGTGWPASAAARSSSPRPCAWSTPRSRSSPASAATTRSVS